VTESKPGVIHPDAAIVRAPVAQGCNGNFKVT